MRRAWMSRAMWAVILLFIVLVAPACCGPTIRMPVPVGPDSPVAYAHWVVWTHPESGQDYMIPQMLATALRPTVWAVIPAEYKRLIQEDMEDLIREQAWIRAAQESRRELLAPDGEAAEADKILGVGGEDD